MTTQEGNKLIAEFMGKKFIEDGNSMWDGKVSICVENLEYHSSWNWLMPVVEKIEKTYEVSIIGKECEIADNGYEWKSICKSTSESKIDAVWQTVVKFIKKNV